MLNLISHLLALLEALTADRTRLALENVMLRQQLAVMKRTTKRPRIEDEDRSFWAFMKEVFKDWKDNLVIVKPETVVRWHREGFARFWAKRSHERRRPGRPPISMKLIHLIRKLSQENATWGAPHIANELALLGHDVGETTVAKYMVKRPPSERKRQSWRAFLKNHMSEAAACDFFTLPTLTFKVLYVFVVLSHDRRRIQHVNVTTNPTAEWTANQIRESFPGGEEPRFLHRDRDAIYGDTFKRAIKSMGIRQVVSARKSPWQNPFVERVIGSIRRECTDHIIPLGERLLSDNYFSPSTTIRTPHAAP
ncbi:MAG: DDE-type integrase/transposase/recombinase [Planctomycetes bacterium]|nr:DDE-type integrase/transposase/recombinase [Planctomycetota bacterium]